MPKQRDRWEGKPIGEGTGLAVVVKGSSGGSSGGEAAVPVAAEVTAEVKLRNEQEQELRPKYKRFILTFNSTDTRYGRIG